LLGGLRLGQHKAGAVFVARHRIKMMPALSDIDKAPEMGGGRSRYALYRDVVDSRACQKHFGEGVESITVPLACP
jgi:hypothetical protein